MSKNKKKVKCNQCKNSLGGKVPFGPNKYEMIAFSKGEIILLNHALDEKKKLSEIYKYP